MRELDNGDMEGFGELDGSEKTIAILGDRWWSQAAKQEGGTILGPKSFHEIHGNNAMSAQLL